MCWEGTTDHCLRYETRTTDPARTATLQLLDSNLGKTAIWMDSSASTLDDATPPTESGEFDG